MDNNIVYSDFWIGNDEIVWENAKKSNRQEEFVENKTIDERLIRLASYQRAITNFVNILTYKNIKVDYTMDGSENYTDGNSITISSKINSKKDFDVTVGLALHEASHILLSDFDLLKIMWIKIPRDTYELGEKINLKKTDVEKMVKRVWNFIEDKYIDDFIFNTAVGYRGYYQSLYDRYFHNKEIDDILKSDRHRKKSWTSYDFRIINFTNENTDLTALPDLKLIYDLIDHKNISRLSKSDDRFKIAVEVSNIILRNIDVFDFDEEKVKMLVYSGQLSSKEASEINTVIARQRDFIDGRINKSKISAAEHSILSVIKNSGITIQPVKFECNSSKTLKSVNCIVIKKLTKELIFSDTIEMFGYMSDKSPFSNHERSVIDGINMGKRLGKKLQIRNEKNTYKFIRRYSGKIEKRLISQIGAGLENIFFKSFTDKYKNANLHISVDSSGSMAGEKWEKTILSVSAICKAASYVNNLRVTVSFRSTTDSHSSIAHNCNPVILLAYDSAIDKSSKIRNLFPYIIPAGLTPEGLTFQAIKENFIKNKNGEEDCYFLNFSDGEPMFIGNATNGEKINYNKDIAFKHTKKMVDEIRNSGVNVLSYFISDGDDFYNKNDFIKMYGQDAKFINVNNVVDIARTMNELFLKKQ